MIRDVLILQKRELEEKRREAYIEREVNIKRFENDLVKVVIGPRRAGKSFFLIHFLKKQHIGYVNFDDESLVKIKNYQEVIDNVKSVYNDPKTLLLDEIQNLDNWELFVNRLKRQGFNLFITGSNSKLLGKELASHLTGRHLSIVILPFSFHEFLKARKNVEELTESEMRTYLNEYLEKGGFPEVVVKNLDFKDYLSMLVDSILQRDIVQRYNVRFAIELREMFYMIASNFSNRLSLNKLRRLSNVKSVHTVKSYVNYLEEAFLILKLPFFSWKVREQLLKPQKFYIIDNGMINAKAFQFSKNIGKLMENLVAIELLRRKSYWHNNWEVFYWSDYQQREVDFVVKQGLKVKQLIQVTYATGRDEVDKREIKSLLKASELLKCKNLLVITWDYEAVEEIKNKKVKFIPLWKWLLNV